MTRGKPEYYKIGEKSYLITKLLRYTGVLKALNRRKTYASKRELLREMLVGKKITPDMIVGYIPEETYGSQKRRAGEPLRNTTGITVEGPRLSHDENYDGPYDPTELPPDRRYGALRRGPLRNTKGQIVEGPRRGKVRVGRGSIYFRGKSRSAREALRIFPKLQEKLARLRLSFVSIIRVESQSQRL